MPAKNTPFVYPQIVPKECVLCLDMQDMGNKLIDQSGQSNHGTNSGSMAISAPYGMVRSFDGTAAYQSVSPASSLDMATALTAEAWIYPTRVNGTYKTILSKRTAAAVNYQMYLNNATGELAFYNGTTQYITTYIPPVNVWTHIAITLNAGAASFYANGILVSSLAAVLGATNAVPLFIGVNGTITASGEYFQGNIGIVRVWNVARPQAELRQQFLDDAWKYGIAS